MYLAEHKEIIKYH